MQLEAYKNKIDDKSIYHGGTQTITTNESYIHPLNFKNGLAYIKLRPYTDTEWDTLLHTKWTSDSTWNPSSFNHNITSIKDWKKEYNSKPEDNHERLFNKTGNYRCDDENIIHIHYTDFIVYQHDI